MLYFAKSFNQPLNSWNVSNVYTITCMFGGAKSFNQPLDKWDTSGIQEMAYAFSECYEFNQNIDSWDTSQVTYMDGMFDRAICFNQPLNSWKTGNVKFMRRMFCGASSFNQPLDQWDVSRVETAEMMFKNATSFSQPLGMWQISRDCDVNEMFLDAPHFTDVKILTLNFAHTNKMRYREYLKKVLGRLDAAQVYVELLRYSDKYSAKYKRELETAHLELKAPVRTATGTGKHKPRSKKELIELLDMGIQLPLDKIDTSCITDMEGLFKDSKSRDFTGLETWDTSNVVTMKSMFANAEYFDHDISGWNVSNVRDMSHMFDGARRFNQPLDSWNVSNVENMYEMFAWTRKFKAKRVSILKVLI